MNVFHGSWLVEQQRFALWGEHSSGEQPSKRGKRSLFAMHPYSLSANDLLKHLDRYSLDSQPDGMKGTIWLPGQGKWPQPSPQALAAGVKAPDGELQLLGWTIPEVVTLGSTDAIDYLLRLFDSTATHQSDLLYGDDLRFWGQAALLAMNYLIEGCYSPVLDYEEARLDARWRAEVDVELFNALAAAMPPLCRALTQHPDSAAGPATLLHSFLASAVDGFVRESYQDRKKPTQPLMIALTGKSRRVSGSARDNRKLYEAWTQWREAAQGGALGALQVCFRLEEPAESSDEWHLSYLLRAADDPSLLVEADLVWEARGRLEVLDRHFENPQERLLAALGLAARIFPPIERSLRQSTPTSVSLSSEEAYQFLIEALPLLESSQFTVMTPDWWKRAARLKARVRIAAEEPNEAGLLGFQSLANYQWELSLGGQAISRREFEELVALKRPVVRFKGEWVTLDPEQVKAALRFLEEEQQEGQIGLLDALRMSEDESAARLKGLEVEEVQVSGWLSELLDRLRDPAQLDLPEVPGGLQAQLRPYQLRGFAWLAQMARAGLGACLADDMGLGKTLQSISFWLAEREAGRLTRPVLVVAPTSVVGNWRHEVRRFAPDLRVMVHQGPDRARGAAFSQMLANHDVVLTSYALLTRDQELLGAVHWGIVALDEAQNIKNPTTRQAAAARALRADQRLALTGTPVENRLSELWSILHFLNPGYLGSREAFRSAFSIPIERYGDQAASERLRRLVAPFILRRLKTDPNVISDLPEKFENKTYCTLSAEQATLYEAVVREEIEAVESAEGDMNRRGVVFRMLTRLKQVCNHPAHFLKESGRTLEGRSGKLDRLGEMIEEVIESGERALIFTQYAEMGELLKPYLEARYGIDVLYLHGGTPARQREEFVSRFQAEQGPPLFLLSLKAGGTGLNLTRASHVFHYDRWYNPAVENQATDRAFRIGQTKNVQVHKFICLGTLEERIDELIEQKSALADSIIGAGEHWIAEMDNTALRELVTLRREIIEEV